MKSKSRGDEKATVQDNVIGVLQAHFPDIPRYVAGLIAQVFEEAADRCDELHHEGTRDLNELRKLNKSLRGALQAIERSSPWIHDALSVGLHNSLMAYSPGSPGVALQHLPKNLKQARVSLELMVGASDKAEEYWMSGRASHGKNWKAIAVIQEARRTWKALSGKPPPRRQLNEETKFARFLTDLFDAIGVGATASAAYDAWWDIASDQWSPLDPPERL